jgi:hypothetical protein
MKRNTKKQYEVFLNELYFDAYSEDQFADNFAYFKGGKIKRKDLLNIHSRREGGTAVRKYDPIMFEVGYNEWKTN